MATCKTTRLIFRGLLAEIERGADLVCGYRAQRKDTLVKAPDKSDREFRPQSFHQGRRARYRLHPQGDAARMRSRPRSVQGHAPFHSCARQRRRLPVGRDSGQPSRRGNLVRANTASGNRAVRATVDMFGVRWLLSRQLRYQIEGLTQIAAPSCGLNCLVNGGTPAKLSLPIGESSCPWPAYYLPSKSSPR